VIATAEPLGREVLPRRGSGSDSGEGDSSRRESLGEAPGSREGGDESSEGWESLQRHDHDERQPLITARSRSSDEAHNKASLHSDSDDEPSESFQGAQGGQRMGERVR